MRRHWRLAVIVLAALVVLPVFVLFAAAWYLSGELDAQALQVSRSNDRLDLIVMAVDGDSVRLVPAPGASPGESWRLPGVYGLQWDGGYGRVHEVLESGDGFVRRRYTPVEGVPPPGAGARIDGFAVPGPAALGVPFEDVAVRGPQGELPAWLFPADGDTWAILVHGQNAPRREMLRQAAIARRLGMPALVVSYRNDEGAPAARDGRLHYGSTEWADLEAAVQYALANGAERVVLVGNSMGGAVVLAYLERSALASTVAALILDAPMVDFAATVEFRAPDWVPGVLMSTGQWVASRRFDVDWSGLDYLARADELDLPILLFHGTADTRVPIATSEALARARPDLVTFVRVEDAGHVRSWNIDPDAYETRMREFLAPVLAAEP